MELVFVVERADFFGGDWPQGFVPLADGDRLLAEFARRGFFVPRAEAEQQPAWKQLIPYCVLRRGDSVLCVQRKTAQTENRLHGMWSIGLGGHVNPVPAPVPAPGAGPGADPRDGDPEAGRDPRDRDPGHRGPRAAPEPSFLAALRQELDEELHHALGAGPEPRFLGLLNDDATPVGQVHAGLVYRLDCRADPGAAVPSVREISKMHGGFRSLAELADLWQDPARFESWSRILMQAGVAGAMAVTELSADRDPQGTIGSKESNHGRTQCNASDA